MATRKKKKPSVDMNEILAIVQTCEYRRGWAFSAEKVEVSRKDILDRGCDLGTLTLHMHRKVFANASQYSPMLICELGLEQEGLMLDEKTIFKIENIIREFVESNYLKHFDDLYEVLSYGDGEG